MKRRPRVSYTEAQKAAMWDRWQRGDSLESIARLFDRTDVTVQQILVRTGGIRPPQRKHASVALTALEREEISRGLVADHSIRTIAAARGNSQSSCGCLDLH